MKFIGLLIVWLAAMAPAQASTVTLLFNGPPTGAQSESGYSFINSSSYSAGGTLDLHDDSGGLQSTSFARTAGGYFNALSVDMRGYQRLYVTGATPGAAPSKLAFNNYRWNGYRNGAQVASASGSLGRGSMVNYLFDQTFSGLSSLQLNLLAPGMRFSIAISGLFAPSGPGRAYCQDYCGLVSIDNLVLSAAQISPVPLPAGFGLLASVLGLGAIGARWRRRRA